MMQVSDRSYVPIHTAPTPGVAFSTAAKDSLVAVGGLEGVPPLGPGGAAA